MNRLLAKLLLVLVAACLPVYTTTSMATEVRNGDVVVLTGEISGVGIWKVGDELIDRSNDPNGSGKVDLIIDSPGGSVTVGSIFINQMEQAKLNGLTIRCFVPRLAASMAFQILLHCNERHTLNSAFLLWHRARVVLGGGLFGAAPMTGPELFVQAKALLATDRQIFGDLMRALGIPRAVVKYHFEAQILHTGQQLHELSPEFITTHEAIGGLFEALQSAQSKSGGDALGRQEMFDYRPGEIIYIDPRRLEDLNK